MFVRNIFLYEYIPIFVRIISLIRVYFDIYPYFIYENLEVLNYLWLHKTDLLYSLPIFAQAKHALLFCIDMGCGCSYNASYGIRLRSNRM